jgi:hypothetical protein
VSTSRPRTALARLGTLLSLPLKAAEEGCHALAAWPWAERVHIWVDAESGEAACDVAFSEQPPRWGLWLAAYAPMLAGALLAGVVALVTLTADVGPSWWGEWLLVAGAVVWWAKLTLPSRADRAVVDDE